MEILRPARSSNPTAKLKDADNTSVPELAFQRQAVQDYRSSQAQDPNCLRISCPPPTLHEKRSISSIDNVDDAEDGADRPPKRCMFSLLCSSLPHAIIAKTDCAVPATISDPTSSSNPNTMAKDPHSTIVIDDEDSGDDGDGAAAHPSDPTMAGGSRKALSNPTAVDVDGFLKDVDVQSVDNNQPSREDKRRDVDNFFSAPALRETNGKLKKYRTCKLCL
jgi:hypothetical protein